MKITGVRMMRLWGPRAHSLGGSKAMIGKCFLRVDTDTELYGIGEVDDFFGVGQAVAYIGAYLEGRDPFDVKPIVSELFYGTLPPHHDGAKSGVLATGQNAIPSMAPTAVATGPIVWAASGVEMALCDLVGKALGAPIYNLLGGRFRREIPIYLDRSSPHEIDDPAAWRNMAADSVAQGFKQLKFDVEYVASDHTQDVWNRGLSTKQIQAIVERLEVVRDAVGWEVEITLDCHMHFNTPTLSRLLPLLEPLRLLWIEDPSPVFNIAAYAEIRAMSPVPLCAGEMFVAEQAKALIDVRGCDIIHPDVMFSGGLHETRRIAEYAELHNLPIALHGNGSALATVAAAHVAAATRNFIGLEYHFIESDWITNVVRTEEPLFKDGNLTLSGKPGLGVELNPDVCRQYLAPGSSLIV